MSATRFFATTTSGTEELLAEELRGLGAEEVAVERGGVAFAGSLAAAYRACLWSRVASRVLLPLARFPAATEDELYEGVRGLDWPAHLGPEHTLAVDCTTTASRLGHSHYAALRTKDAIVDQLRERLGARPSIDTARPDVRVNLHLHADVATVSIDLSGEALHRRGYRGAAPGEGVAAPLKENLAAALLLLGGWPALAREGVPFFDPMCGSGTLVIEAAFIAADVAPGLLRDYFGFLGWRGHAAAAWAELLDEARERRRAGLERALPPLVGCDADARVIRTALANARRAGLERRVRLEVRPLAEAQPGAAEAALPERGPRGLLVVNPPYGERLGEEEELGALYQALGDVLRQRFMGWTALVFTGNRELARRIGLRPARRFVLHNGPIECRLLLYPISAEPVRSAEGPRWRQPRPPDPAIEMFQNRVRKNLRHLGKWARREGVRCYRVYDADLPEYAVAVDLYEDAAHVQEYEPPATVDAERAQMRLEDIVAVLPETLGVQPEDVFVKVRRRQRGGTQYDRQGDRGAVREVSEGGLRFLVNLSDYLDTGLFLDHRRLRELLGEWAAGRDFLNLFSYTGTASVYAARGGARSTTSVDLSATYLEWADRNFALNGLAERTNRLVRADCLEFLARERRRYGLIFCAPPTFSASKRMEGTFDLQRDHVRLLTAAAALLTPDGVLVFSSHFRRFRMDREALAELRIEDITRTTIPPDFARNPRIHTSWRITRA